MDNKAVKTPLSQLYYEDFAEWSCEAGAALRDRRFQELDVEHLAEEIDDMGLNLQREVISRLTLIMVHLLKWTFQPDKRSRSWRATINTHAWNWTAFSGGRPVCGG